MVELRFMRKPMFKFVHDCLSCFPGLIPGIAISAFPVFPASHITIKWEMSSAVGKPNANRDRKASPVDAADAVVVVSLLIKSRKRLQKLRSSTHSAAAAKDLMAVG